MWFDVEVSAPLKTCCTEVGQRGFGGTISTFPWDSDVNKEVMTLVGRLRSVATVR